MSKKTRSRQPSLLTRIPGDSRPRLRRERTASSPPPTLTATTPPKTFCIPLGSGQAVGLGVGNKAALLDQAAYHGLPVPGGVILLHHAWQQAEQAGFVRAAAGQVTVLNPYKLLRLLKLPDFTRPLAVRSAFSAEDNADASLAGFFTSCLFVDPTDTPALAEALARVWESALRRDGEFRRDVLLMEMVEAAQAGVVFTEPAFEDDLVNYTAGVADRLVGGQETGQTLLLPHRRWWESAPTQPETPFAPRLQLLLHQVRRLFGARGWDIEWADDGRHCWLVQLRPITRAVRRNEAFTMANMREILPDLPSRFMTSTIASCAPGLFEYYRRFDSGLPTTRPIIEVFRGRPAFNLSLLTEMMRRWGLPTGLVTGNIGGQTEQEAGLKPVRFLSSTPILLRVGWAQLTATRSARRTIAQMQQKTETPGDTLSDCVETLRWTFTRLVTEMFSLTSAMSGPLLLLRRAGTLAQHNARQQTIATKMYTDLAPLQELAAENETIREALEAERLPDDADFQALWQAYLEQHGHRGVFESDIARPRLHEAPAATLQSLAHGPQRRARKPRRTVAGLLTLPLWWQAGRAIRAREQLRYQAMASFDHIRQQLLTLAEALVQEKRLPDTAALWLLSIDEVRQLEQSWTPDDDFFAQRRAEITELETYDLPDMFYRFDDLEQYRQGAAAADQPARLQGISLTEGQVTGKAWVLREPETRLPDGFERDTTILVARSVDAGWIPTFNRVAGVVVEIGGDLSHGSIILREIGLPAITNVRGATQAIATGDELLLRADEGVVAHTQPEDSNSK